MRGEERRGQHRNSRRMKDGIRNEGRGEDRRGQKRA
jgi:hypothetical protein